MFLQDIPDVKESEVLVMGLGLFGGGEGVTRFLCEQGANVRITDLRSADALQESINNLDDLNLSFTLGEHRKKEFKQADMVVVNPAVPLDSPYLQHARDHDVPLESELNLFVKLCPSSVTGVTGTVGKSTTTSLIHHILAQEHAQNTFIGGNIGQSLLPELDRISADSQVILEISSFQLEQLAAIEYSPEVAVATNISPNHLDRHGNYEQYKQAKYSIAQFQHPSDHIVLNADDKELQRWTENVPGTVWQFSLEPRPKRGSWLEDGQMMARSDQQSPAETICHREIFPLPGNFNVENALAAVSASMINGASFEQIRDGLSTFEPLSDHLDIVGRVNGVEMMNDSVSTSPDSTISALEAIAGDTVFIVGGYDKGSSLEELGKELVREASGVVLLGETAEDIDQILQDFDTSFPRRMAETMEEAVEVGLELAGSHGTVVLSPGCASYDMYRNYRERGKHFEQIVSQQASQS